MSKPRLAFISPVFLFPNDTGGRIRTTNILRGLKGGYFDVTLLGPATTSQRSQWKDRLQQLADDTIFWQPSPEKPRWKRAFDLMLDIPVNVAADRTPENLSGVADALSTRKYDVVVFDFVHAAVLHPGKVSAATVCFTHNIEAEIFGRHAKEAGNFLMRRVWSAQFEKMKRFENDSLKRFTSVVAVSERDATYFEQSYGLTTVSTIPTGVDLDFFSWNSPPENETVSPTVVFTGSMDWAANIDGISFFLDEVWPKVLEQVPAAKFVVVGRRPPPSLLEKAKASSGVQFTGYVDDVRPYVRAAHAFVIPLRVGGGTRIKAFEALSMGCPVVSTAIGIEGLDIYPGEHFLLADTANELVRDVIRLLSTSELRSKLSRNGRECVEQKFGHLVAAKKFEEICVSALTKYRG